MEPVRDGARVPNHQSEVLFTPKALQESATALLALALKSDPGAWAESLVTLWPLQTIEMDFDGAGGILVNPPSLEHATGRAMLAELQRQAPELIKVGIWPREGEVE